jgi:hypothetical protein
MTEHELCSLVVEHQKTIGSMDAKIDSIMATLGNGLSKQLKETAEKLDKFITDDAIRAVKIENENWFSKILSGSARKIIGIVVFLIMMSGLVNAGIWTYLKINYLKETPGQQKEILAQSKIAASDYYHTHIMHDGRTVLHCGNPNLPAFILDPTTGKYEPAPQYRTEEGIK